MADYTYWTNALAGKFGEVHDGHPQLGFFSKRTGKSAGFVPVAIWSLDGNIVALVDGNAASAEDVWTYCCTHPVTEEQYRARVETGKWHDEDAAVTDSLTHRTNTNNPATDEAEILKSQIEAASAGVAEYANITDDPTANKAQSLRSRLLELSGQADKVREAQKKPHFEAGKAVDAKFQPLVKAAKAAADLIRDALGAHETRKAKEAARLQAIADEARIKAEREAVKARAAAELAGKPVTIPEPAPAPVAPAPEPVTAIRGAYGRAASVKVVKVATVKDQDAAYGFLKAHKELSDLIAQLAQRAVNAGYAVPGVEVTEERKVA